MNDKKRIILTVIGIVFIIILLFGATYAYFGVAVTNDEGITNVGIDADEIGSIALTNPTPNLHISLSSKDMSLDNVGEYYATNESNKYYDEDKIQREILGVNLIGGSSSDVYECSATLKINLEGTAVGALQKGDAYIQFGGLLTDKVDLTEIPSDGYDISVYLVPEQSATRKITASIALVNKVGNQSYLAGKGLAINISTDNFQCTLTDLGNNTVNSTNSSTLAISGNVGTELNNYKIYGNSIQNGTPSPTNPVEIDSVGDYDEETGKYVIPVTTRGKNLFDKTKYINGQVGQPNLTTMYPISTYGVYRIVYIPIEEGKTYTISQTVFGKYARYALTDSIVENVFSNNITAYTLPDNSMQEDIITFSALNSTSNTRTFINKFNHKYLVAFIYAQSDTYTYDEIADSIQVELGTTATLYEPYVEPITTNIYLDEPLRKVGEVSDYIDFNNGKVVRNIGAKTLVGAQSEYWVKNDFFSTTAINHKIGAGLCTHLVYDSTIVSNNTFRLFPTDYIMHVMMTDLTTVDEMKTWLSEENANGTPMKVYYQYLDADIMENPIELQNIPIFDQTTIVEIGTSINPSSIEATYLTEN